MPENRRHYRRLTTVFCCLLSMSHSCFAQELLNPAVKEFDSIRKDHISKKGEKFSGETILQVSGETEQINPASLWDMPSATAQTSIPPTGLGLDPFAPQVFNAPPQDPQLIYQMLLQQELARRHDEELKEEQKNAEEREKKKAESWTANPLLPVKVSSPLGETLWDSCKKMSVFSPADGPDKGCGMPLVNQSWLDHPYYFGGFVGPITGSKFIDNIKQKKGTTGGIFAGYNFDNYWGLESRVHFSSLGFTDDDKKSRSHQFSIVDFSLRYYPLGNARFRPFFTYGLGTGRETFTLSQAERKYAETVVTMPFGAGLRYWWNDRLAIEGEIIDNTVFASKIAKTQSNWGFTIGFSYAFGSNNQKRPVHYWPATPSMGSKW